MSLANRRLYGNAGTERNGGLMRIAAPSSHGMGTTLLVVLASFALVVATAGVAQAQQRTVRDRRGDAPASADLTRVSVRNAARAVTVRLKVRNLQRFSDLTLNIDHRGAGRYVFRTAGTRRGFVTFERPGADRRVPCSGRRVTRFTGTRSALVVRIPQRCLGNRAGRARFSVTMFQSRGMGSDRVTRMPIAVRRG